MFLLPYEAFIGFVRFKFGFSLSVLSFSLGVNRSWVGEEGDWEWYSDYASVKKKKLTELFVKLNQGKKRDWVGVEWVGLNYFYGGSLDIYPRFYLDLT